MRTRKHVLVGDRPIDMRLGREVHDQIAPLDRPGNHAPVLDRTLDELDPTLDIRQVLPPPRVRQLVQHHDLHARPRLQRHPDVGRPDEPGRTCHQQPHAATSSRTPARRSLK
jgi:hypothetical protein